MQDDYDDDQFDQTHLREKQGSSGMSKVLLFVAGTVGVMALLCCGGVAYFFSKFKGPEHFTEPAQITTLRESMLDVAIPERFKPSNGMTMDMLVYKMDMVFYHTEDEETQLMFMKSNFSAGEANQEEVRQEMSKNLDQHNEMKDWESETKTYTLDGKEVEVTFTHGTLKPDKGVPDEQAGKEWFSVTGYIPVEGGIVLFSESGPEDAFDQDEVDAMIQSIKLK